MKNFVGQLLLLFMICEKYFSFRPFQKTNFFCLTKAKMRKFSITLNFRWSYVLNEGNDKWQGLRRFCASSYFLNFTFSVSNISCIYITFYHKINKLLQNSKLSHKSRFILLSGHNEYQWTANRNNFYNGFAMFYICVS